MRNKRRGSSTHIEGMKIQGLKNILIKKWVINPKLKDIQNMKKVLKSKLIIWKKYWNWMIEGNNLVNKKPRGNIRRESALQALSKFNESKIH